MLLLPFLLCACGAREGEDKATQENQTDDKGSVAVEQPKEKTHAQKVKEMANTYRIVDKIGRVLIIDLKGSCYAEMWFEPDDGQQPIKYYGSWRIWTAHLGDDCYGCYVSQTICPV